VFLSPHSEAGGGREGRETVSTVFLFEKKGKKNGGTVYKTASGLLDDQSFVEMDLRDQGKSAKLLCILGTIDGSEGRPNLTRKKSLYFSRPFCCTLLFSVPVKTVGSVGEEIIKRKERERSNV